MINRNRNNKNNYNINDDNNNNGILLFVIFSILQGDDTSSSFSVYGQEVNVISSKASGLQQSSPGSNKVLHTLLVLDEKYYNLS